ncbi:GtrA family protein [Pseudomonas mosselii]|uniref:GtrA family protein n=1 Tax=Pseudomonas mosselii TaxID=78327 RepID=UPI0024487FDE|nr:GtrA family protein [Pseudomonas mosselii]MDH1147169.1 GtrA family protein [Pseudomonas mosselii]
MRFFRYLLVQVLAYAVDLGGFALLVNGWGTNPLLANTIGKVLAGLFAFVAHRQFTFGVTTASSRSRQALRYFALLALNIPLSALILSALLWALPMPLVAKFIADVACVFLTYWLSKRFVFLGGDDCVVDHSAVGRGRE